MICTDEDILRYIQRGDILEVERLDTRRRDNRPRSLLPTLPKLSSSYISDCLAAEDSRARNSVSSSYQHVSFTITPPFLDSITKRKEKGKLTTAIDIIFDAGISAPVSTGEANEVARTS
jgi:hypothetical protein